MVSIKLSGENRFRADSHKTFADALIVVQGALERGRCDGSYTLVPRARIRWRSKEKHRIALRPSQGREIRMKVRPSDNDSAWEYSLLSGGDVDMDSVRQNLEHIIGPEDHTPAIQCPDQPEPVVVERKIEKPSTGPGPMEMLAKLSGAIQREQARVSERKDIEAEIDLLTQQIEQLSKVRETRVQRLLDLEVEQSKDTEAKAACNLLALLAQMQG